ncbi:DUF1804 family protein [Neisseria sp. S1]|uniref:DUF1804 family protein n=1 Tax=Neisseria sp. S1 TaxID=3318354 RepID=UPI003A8813B8
MAHPKETRDKLRQLYVSGGQTLETAAMMCQVPFATARNWKASEKAKGNDWDKMRAAHTLAGGDVEVVARAMIAGQILQYESVMKELEENHDLNTMDKVKAISMLSDSYNKTMAAHKRLLPEVHEASVAIKTIDLLAQHIKQNYPNLIEDFLKVLDSFEPVIEQEF